MLLRWDSHSSTCLDRFAAKRTCDSASSSVTSTRHSGGILNLSVGVDSSSFARFDTFFSGSVGKRSIVRLTGLPGRLPLGVLTVPFFVSVPNSALAGLRFPGLWSLSGLVDLVVGVRCVSVPVSDPVSDLGVLMLFGVPNGGLKGLCFARLRVLFVGVPGVAGISFTGLACFSGLLLVGVPKSPAVP
jgi:hypothetical protein